MALHSGAAVASQASPTIPAAFWHVGGASLHYEPSAALWLYALSGPARFAAHHAVLADALVGHGPTDRPRRLKGGDIRVSLNLRCGLGPVPTGDAASL